MSFSAAARRGFRRFDGEQGKLLLIGDKLRAVSDTYQLRRRQKTWRLTASSTRFSGKSDTGDEERDRWQVRYLAKAASAVALLDADVDRVPSTLCL